MGRRWGILAVAAVVGWWPRPARATRCERPEIHVHKGRGQLILTCAKTPRLVLPVTFGGSPRGHKRRSGDERTPEGRYRVCGKHRSKRYHRFIAISYPGIDDARRALQRGLITRGQYRAIARAQRGGRCPPFRTPLGGAIGIHGVDPEIDWLARVWDRLSRVGRLYRAVGVTDGCIATSNAFIDRLWPLVTVGTPVYIHPVGP